MGLPLRLVAAVNRNDIVYRTLSKGDFSKSEEVVVSLAPAMDIQVSKKNGILPRCGISMTNITMRIEEQLKVIG